MPCCDERVGRAWGSRMVIPDRRYGLSGFHLKLAQWLPELARRFRSEIGEAGPRRLPDDLSTMRPSPIKKWRRRAAWASALGEHRRAPNGSNPGPPKENGLESMW